MYEGRHSKSLCYMAFRSSGGRAFQTTGPATVNAPSAETADRNNYYRAMHFIAKRSLAIACRLSVCL